LENNARAGRSAYAPRIAVFDKPFEATLKRAQFLQLPAQINAMHLSEIALPVDVPTAGLKIGRSSRGKVTCAASKIDPSPRGRRRPT
jgi:hypothetical protein